MIAPITNDASALMSTAPAATSLASRTYGMAIWRRGIPVEERRPISANDAALLGSCVLHHRIALRLKLIAGFPFRELGAVRNFVADHEQKLHVLHRAG